MPSYNTPGVYVEEISSLPPSIAPVATAIPAFIGYTEKADKDGVTDALHSVPTRITSMLEYREFFGGPKAEIFAISIDDEKDSGGTILNRSISVLLPATSGYNLYYSMQMYFNNGGGPCYIVSIGKYDTAFPDSTNTDFKNGIAVLEKIDEPTLLVFPDAVNLSTATLYGGVASDALAHCNKLQDRFTILDAYQVESDNGVDTAALNTFREKIGNDNLKYGAAYFPTLKSTLNYGFHYDHDDQKVSHMETVGNGSPTASIHDGKKLKEVDEAEPSLYRQIAAGLNNYYVDLPPSGAVAGIYARVDNDRGVWKAPANVSVRNVIGPAVQLTDEEHGLLNVDAGSGKSVNAIRTFTGKGTLVWGARTLAGNDNEWRYVPVRRFFIFAEESIKKASSFFVFEPNDGNTWVKVRSMIENFLTVQWRDGALAGAKPEEAFFVKVGLGQTMTAQDILEGYMHIEIGLAVVRPAEFIVLKFSHKMQES